MLHNDRERKHAWLLTSDINNYIQLCYMHTWVRLSISLIITVCTCNWSGSSEYNIITEQRKWGLQFISRFSHILKPENVVHSNIPYCDPTLKLPPSCIRKLYGYDPSWFSAFAKVKNSVSFSLVILTQCFSFIMIGSKIWHEVFTSNNSLTSTELMGKLVFLVISCFKPDTRVTVISQISPGPTTPIGTSIKNIPLSCQSNVLFSRPETV